MNPSAKTISRRSLLAGCAPFALGACTHFQPATVDTSLQPSARAFEQTGIHWSPQQDHHCGPAALWMAMHQAGARQIQYEEVVKLAFTPGREGSLQVDMLATPRTLGFVSYPIQGSLSDLLELNMQGHSPIVLLNLSFNWWPKWHYALITGHEMTDQTITLTSGTSPKEVLPIGTFIHLWGRSNHWAMVIARPGQIPAQVTASTAESATVAFERVNEYQASLLQWRRMTELWPQRLNPWLGLGHAQMTAKDWQGAQTTLEWASQHFESAVAWNNLAEVLLALNQTAAARRAAQQGLQIAKAKEPIWVPALERTLTSIEAPR